MVQEAIRWLVDKGLPQISEDNPNVLHLSGNSRDVLSEALKGGRTVVTHNEYILHSRTIPFNCPPIVIINGVSLTREALLRNLRHFEFCLLHDKGTLSMTGQRFFIDIDRAIYKWQPNGTLQEMEAWKNPSINFALASNAST